jgi:uncharacterized protein YjiS (DUF1127 family)
MSTTTTLSQGASSVMGLLSRLVVRPFASWRARQLALEELSALDDHMLADIGISRGEIPGIVTGKLPPRRAVNENASSAAA